MINVLLSGCGGKMGKKIIEGVANNNELSITAGVDAFTSEEFNFPVYKSFKEIEIIPDVIIDFSHPAVLSDMLDFALKNKVPAVIATTGLSKEQIEQIKVSSNEIPIFFTFNMSLGINLLISLSKTAATVLGTDFDIEIIEKHHNQKIDAPSGTAIMLANSINDVFGDKMLYEYDRHSKREKRKNSEIGIHSVRAGTIVGEHEVIFAGNDEIISIKHTALSKAVFATGAIKAALFLTKQKSGLYDMSNLI